MATEYERKFKASPAILEQIDRAFSGDRQVFSMETTYFDTPGGAMSARKFTLRTRLENGVSVCTLKTPAGAARNEWETECEDIREAIPLFLEMGCPREVAALAEEGLIPICGAKFTRIAKTVTLEHGTVELALDQGCLLGGGREAPLCEVEVELKSGAEEVCDGFAAVLVMKFALQPEEKSKFRRALALYRGE